MAAGRTEYDLVATLRVEGAASVRSAGDAATKTGKSWDSAGKSASGAATKTKQYSSAATKSSKSSAAAARSSRDFSAASDKVGVSLAKVLKKAIAVAAAYLSISAASLALTRSIGVFSQFESSMAAVQAVTTASRDEMDSMTASARHLGETTRFSASQAAEGMEYLGRAGFEATQIVGAMPGVLNLAAAAKLDLGSAADITSNIMSAFNIAASDSSLVADKLALSAASANIDVEGLGQAMKFVGPVASALNRSLSETAAAVGILGDVGLADVAGRGLRTTLSSLAKMSDDAKAALKELGLTAADVDPQTQSLADVFDVLGQRGLTATQAFRIFGNEGASVALSLAANAGRLREFTGELDLAEGAASRMADTMNDTLEGAAAEMKSVFESLQIDLVTQFTPALREGADVLKAFMEDNRGAIVGFGKAVASSLGSVIQIFGFVSDNAELLAVALGTLAAAFALLKFAPLIQSSALLTLTMTDLAGAALALPAIFTTSGTTAVAGARGFDAYGAAAQRAAAGTNTLTAAIKANPVLWGGTAIIAALLAINAAVKDWGDVHAQETARIVANADKIRVAHEKTFDAINSGSLQTMEIQRRMLVQQKGSADLRRKELEIEERYLQRVVDERFNAGLAYGEQANALKAVQDELEDLEAQSAGYGRDVAQLTKHMEIFRDVVGDELPGSFEELRAELVKLRDEAGEKGLTKEVGRLNAMIAQVDVEMKKAAGAGGGVSGLKNAFAELKGEISNLGQQLDIMKRFGVGAEAAARVVQILMDPDSPNRTVEEILEQIAKLEALEAQLQDVIDLQEIQRQFASGEMIFYETPYGPVPGQAPTVQDEVRAGIERDRAARKKAHQDRIAQEKEAQKEAEKFRKIQEKNLEMAKKSADRWRDAGRVIAGVFDDMGSDLGDLIVGLGDAAAAWKEYAAQRRAYNAAEAAGDQEGMAAAAAGMQGAQGAGYASLWNAAGSYLGSSLAGGGTSGFGGELRGTYSQEGYQVGSLFGPVWGAVGAVLGGFIEKAGDEARVSLENFGDQIQAGVDYAEGGLGDAASTVAAEMNNFISTIEGQFGIALQETGGLQFEFKDTGVLEVRIAGLVIGFRDLGEALGWAAEQLLKLNRDVPGLGENMQALLGSLGGRGAADSMEQLQAALMLAREADQGAAGPQLAAMQEITAQRQRDMELAQQFNLVYEDVLAVTDRRIAQLRDEVDALRAGLFGTRNFAAQALEIVNAMEAFNKGIGIEAESRRRALAGLEAMSAGLQDVATASQDALDEIRAGGGAAHTAMERINALDQAMHGAGRTAARMGGEISGVNDAFAGSINDATGMIEAFEAAKKARFEERRELFENISAAERNREAIDALNDSLAEIPEQFSAQEIADVWTKAADDAGLTLLGLIRQVRGAEFGAAQERALMTSAFRLQLAVQLQAVYQLLEAAETLRASTRAILTDLAAQAEAILGDPNLSIRPQGGGGGGARDAERQRRREFREGFMQDLADTREILYGMGEAAVKMAQALREITEHAEEARKMGVAEEDIAEYRRQQLDLMRQGFTDDLQDTISGGDSSARELYDQYQDIATEAWLLAAARAEEFGTTVEEEMGPLADMIRQAFGVELTDFIRGQVGDLVSDRDLEGLQDLRTELSRLMRGASIDGDMFTGIVGGESLTMRPEEYAAAFAEIEAGLMELQGSLVGSFVVPLHSAREAAADFGDRLRLLRAVIEETGEGVEVLDEIASQANNSLLGMVAGLYDQLGATEEAEEIKQQLARATFELELMQMEILYQEQLALGIVSAETQARMEEFFAFMEGIDLDTVFGDAATPAGTYGGGGTYDPQQYADNVEGLINAIQGTIDQWLQIGQGPLLSQALQMNTDLASARQQMEDLLAMENSPRTRALAAELEAAFAEMSQAWADQVLADMADTNDSLADEFSDLLDHFADVEAAFAELGILAENAEALAAAQAAALDAFFARATEGINSLIDDLTKGPESGRAPMDLLAEQQALVQDLVTRAMGGDLDALEQLESEGRSLLDLINTVYGSGAAGGALRDELLAMLEGVAGLDFPGVILGEDGTGTGPGSRPSGGGGVLEPYELQGTDIVAKPLQRGDIVRAIFGDGAASKFIRGESSAAKYEHAQVRPARGGPTAQTPPIYDQDGRMVVVGGGVPGESGRDDEAIVRALREELRMTREEAAKQAERDREERVRQAREEAERADGAAIYTVRGIVQGLKDDAADNEGGSSVRR